MTYIFYRLPYCSISDLLRRQNSEAELAFQAEILLVPGS